MEIGSVIFFLWAIPGIALACIGVYMATPSRRFPAGLVLAGGLVQIATAVIYIEPAVYRVGMSRQAGALQEQLRNTEKALASNKSTLTDNLLELRRLTDETKRLQARLNGSIQELKEEVELRKKTEQTLATANTQKASLENTLKVMQTSKTQLESQLTELKKTDSQKSQQLADLKDKLANIMKQPGDTNAKMVKRNVSEAKCKPIRPNQSNSLPLQTTSDSHDPLAVLGDRLNSELFEIRLSENQVVVDGLEGRYYDIVLRLSSVTSLPPFAAKQFEVDPAGPIAASFISFLDEIAPLIERPDGCILFVKGRADFGKLKEPLAPAHSSYGHIRVRRLLQSGRYDEQESWYEIGEQYTNNDLPNLRAEAFRRLVRRITRLIPVVVLDEGPAAHIDPRLRALQIFLFVPNE